MDYSKKTELRIMSHNIWCGPVYNRDLHMRDIYMRYLPDVLALSLASTESLESFTFFNLFLSILSFNAKAISISLFL